MGLGFFQNFCDVTQFGPACHWQTSPIEKLFAMLRQHSAALLYCWSLALPMLAMHNHVISSLSRHEIACSQHKQVTCTSSSLFNARRQCRQLCCRSVTVFAMCCASQAARKVPPVVYFPPTFLLPKMPIRIAQTSISTFCTTSTTSGTASVSLQGSVAVSTSCVTSFVTAPEIYHTDFAWHI